MAAAVVVSFAGLYLFLRARGPRKGCEDLRRKAAAEEVEFRRGLEADLRGLKVMAGRCRDLHYDWSEKMQATLACLEKPGARCDDSQARLAWSAYAACPPSLEGPSRELVVRCRGFYSAEGRSPEGRPSFDCGLLMKPRSPAELARDPVVPGSGGKRTYPPS
jgi:hypothetical protein